MLSCENNDVSVIKSKTNPPGLPPRGVLARSHIKNGEIFMIELNKINGNTVLVNCDLIEYVEETPDTVVTLTTGRKLIVKESRQEIKNLVKCYKQEIYHG